MSHFYSQTANLESWELDNCAWMCLCTIIPHVWLSTPPVETFKRMTIFGREQTYNNVFQSSCGRRLGTRTCVSLWSASHRRQLFKLSLTSSFCLNFHAVHRRNATQSTQLHVDTHAHAHAQIHSLNLHSRPVAKVSGNQRTGSTSAMTEAAVDNHLCLFVCVWERVMCSNICSHFTSGKGHSYCVHGKCSTFCSPAVKIEILAVCYCSTEFEPSQIKKKKKGSFHTFTFYTNCWRMGR